MSELSEYEALLNEVVPNEKQYIGKPCKYGHRLRLKSNRHCIECSRNYHNKERIRIAAARWRANNPDCVRRHNAKKLVENMTDEQIESKRLRDARRIYISAGGKNFYIGTAPTIEDAQRIKEKIKREAPR